MFFIGTQCITLQLTKGLWKHREAAKLSKLWRHCYCYYWITTLSNGGN